MDLRQVATELPIPYALASGMEWVVKADGGGVVGIREFILKPIIMRDLAKTVRNVLDQSWIERFLPCAGTIVIPVKAGIQKSRST